MSSSKTKNLNMHSWAATDAVLRSEFNDNFNLLDSAVGAVRSTVDGLSSSFGSCEIFTGTYVGTSSTEHTLYFPRLPDFIFIQRHLSENPHSAVVYEGSVIMGYGAYSRMHIKGTDITIENSSQYSFSLNESGKTFHYMALRSVKE